MNDLTRKCCINVLTDQKCIKTEKFLWFFGRYSDNIYTDIFFQFVFCLWIYYKKQLYHLDLTKHFERLNEFQLVLYECTSYLYSCKKVLGGKNRLF